MVYSYYPGCSLTGSAKRLDVATRKILTGLGYTLKEIPEWNCCGAVEYGNKEELLKLSGENLKKAEGLSKHVIAPCPACYRNLKESDHQGIFHIYNPLDLFDISKIKDMGIKRDLKNMLFTPYYGCVLLRPKETAIKNKNIMEEIITGFGGEIDGEKIRDRCCGGNLFFSNKEMTEKCVGLIASRSKGIFVVYCPLCHMALNTFSERKVVYITDIILYILGERKTI
ncbi:MAG: heterodisulfide reductase-related iron-sulfur binding cluster [Syntrophorhabdaceae bacterium]|nr:heterodisulfide reductase-related iron-sulfur binding cluster [Syntrophorhabdaceae bacterium]